ncbi:Dot/Icm T4SS effector VpdC [Legionella maioricensis]|uniref:Patatin-like phospholipase family protein n=1 Tax=Legionella maioricensis TaxID=2896528 RepID=A0A9X2IB89_9GAMM|nr:Dot/Icm T4SS effector VpdC [Legionella maioricensis]MCL9684245.1 patatin-like phospholipase family protein [Legionella maioricensis]MCL9687111.1 patatin-like phospholipase family protein [Legionella maioricensis]
MTPQHVISQLLESDTRYPKNLDLLKKIILTTYLGRLRINNLSPDNRVTLGSYLFDEERVMFDYTRLSDHKRALFRKWLLDDHQEEKKTVYLSNVHVNEYRGFTAEVALSWWGRLISWFEDRFSEQWKITDLNLSLNYQLTGIEICHGQHGSLIGFNQFLAPRTGTKYKAADDPQQEPLGNTKRVFITDALVDQLMKTDLNSINYGPLCKSPHPQSIEVINQEARHQEMHDYRAIQKFRDHKPWYIKLWRWCSSLLIEQEEQPIVKSPIVRVGDPSILYENETIKIYQREPTKEILVKEKRPEISNLVLCGGGGKIFAHIGVWKALCEANIRPVNFAGSSAGAIMSLLCYLGYTAEEITDLFKHFRQEHLVFYDIDRNGLSDPHSLKTALDYAIALKIKQIVAKYKVPYPEGKISFTTLDALKKQCPGCGIGDKLIVTATNKRLRQTRYFSLEKSPLFEVSEAVKTSASFPVVYRGTVIDGEEHNDGGILSNFPTEAFPEDHSTLLESEFGNNLKVLAVQFDNGTERTAIDRIERVYRENFFVNWLYGLLTGVKDPASAWEQDRMKLRKYASQSIVVNVDNISSSSFNVDDESRVRIIQNGEDATKSYLDVRYEKKGEQRCENQEEMYSTFNSLGDLLAYCCYRRDKHWFEIVNNLIVQSKLPNRTALMNQALELRQLYFNSQTVVESPAEAEPTNPVTFFGNAIPQEQPVISEENHSLLVAIYPVFLKIPLEFAQNKTDKRRLEAARHSLTLHSPLRCLDHLTHMSGQINIVLHIFTNLLKELKENSNPDVYSSLQDLQSLLYSNIDLFKAEYYGNWDLSLQQSLRVLKLFNSSEPVSISRLLTCLRAQNEPMQTVIDGVYYDDFSDGSQEECSMGFSVP